jgi:hypothetical protein
MLDHTNIQEENNNFNAFELLINSEGPPDPNYVFNYKVLRKKEYPPIEDFIDAWVKQDDDALEEYRQACLIVKSKYPKIVRQS